MSICQPHDTARPLPWPAISLLPHRPPMLLVEALTGREESRSQAKAVLPEAGLFIEQGLVTPEYFVELVAQTAALGNRYDQAVQGQAPGGGMIVGVDGFSWPAAATPKAELQVHTEIAMVFATMKVVRGEVRQGDSLLAAGEVRVWEEEGTPLPVAAEGDDAWQNEAGPTHRASLTTAIAACCRRGQEAERTATGVRWRGEYLFAHDFPGFAGHFPGNPLLPAVVQLAVVRHGVARLLGRSPAPSFLERVKFKGMIRPGDEAVLSLDLKDQDGESRAGFTWKRADGSAISSGTLRFS